jgi:hypothetical protein
LSANQYFFADPDGGYAVDILSDTAFSKLVRYSYPTIPVSTGEERKIDCASPV